MTFALASPNIRVSTYKPEDTMNASEIIDRLGGTFETARLCEVKPPSVSEWRKTGIPEARLMYLKLARPDVFEDPPSKTDPAQ